MAIFNKAASVLLAITVIVPSFIFPNFIAVAEAAQGVPSIISYQGRLTDANGNLLGSAAGTTYYFKFAIYNAVTGGTQLWPATAPNSFGTVVRQGVFNVNIGDTVAGFPHYLDYNFNTAQPVYLEVEASSDNASFEALSPRLLIASAAYAQLSAAVSGTSTPSSFGTTTPTAFSQVTIEATTTTSVPLTIRAALGQTSNLFQIQEPLDAINKFIVDSNFRLGLGTTTLGGDLGSFSLGVEGSVLVGNFLTTSYITATSTTATSTFNGGTLFAKEGGNVGIGTTTPGFGLLSVGGPAYLGSLSVGGAATTTAGVITADYIDSRSRIRVKDLVNCDTIDTDASGVLRCGNDATAAGGGISTVQEDDVTVDAAANTLDFLGPDFDVTSGPGGEANVAINYFTTGGNLVIDGDAFLNGSDLNLGNGIFATTTLSGQYGKLGLSSTTPYAQVGVEADQAVVGSNTPIFVIGDQGTSTLFGINWGGVVGIGTATPAGAEDLNGFGLAIATNTLIGGNLTVTGNTDFQGTINFGSAGTTTFAGGVDAAGLSSSQGLSVSSGDAVLAGKLTVSGTGTSTIQNVNTVTNLSTANLNITGQSAFAGRLEVNGTATSSFAGGVQAAGLSSSQGIVATAGDIVGAGKLTINGVGTSTITNLTGTSLNFANLSLTGQFTTTGRLEVNGAATSSFTGGITAAGLSSSQGLTVSTGDSVLGGKLTVFSSATSTIPTLSSTAISAATLNLSSRIDSTFAGTNTYTGNISLASLNANDLQVTDQASFGGRLEVNGAATSSFAGGLTASGLSTSNGLFVTGGDSHFTGGATSFGSSSPYAQVSIEPTSIVGSSTPIFVVGSQGTTSPIFGINWAGVIGISTATPVGAENLNGFGLAVATDTLIGANLTVTGTTDFQGGISFGNGGTTTFAGGIDAVGLNSSQGLTVTTGDTVLAGKLTVNGSGTSTITNLTGTSLNFANLSLTGQLTTTGRLEVNGAATSSFAGGVQSVGLSSSQGLAVTAGDTVLTGKLRIDSSATSSAAGGLSANLLNSETRLRVGELTSCDTIDTDASGVLRCGSDATGAGGGVATIQREDADVVTAATVIDFLGADFEVTNSPAGEGNVSISYFSAGNLTIDSDAFINGSDINIGKGLQATTTLSGQYGKLGFGSTSPWGQVAIEATSITGSNTPIFVIGSIGTTSPLLGVNWAGVVSIGTATPVGAENLNGIGLAVATNTLIGGTLTVTDNVDVQGGTIHSVTNFSNTATTTFAGGVDAAGLSSSQGIAVTAGDILGAGKLTISGTGTSTIQNLNVVDNLLTADINATGQASFGGHLEVNGAATSSFAGGITAAGLNSSQGLTVSTGDSVLAGKLTVSSTATSTIPSLSSTAISASTLNLSSRIDSSFAGTNTFTGNISLASLNANDLQVTDQASFAGRLEVNGVATSSFAGGVTAAGLNSSQGLTVSAGDIVGAGKLTINGVGTSTIPSLSSTALSASTLNLSSRIDSTFAGTNTFNGSLILSSLNANDLQVVDQASFGGRLEVNGSATSSFIGGVTAANLNAVTGLSVGADSVFGGKITVNGTGTSTITNLTGTNLNFANLSLTGQFTTVGRLEVNGAATSSFAGGITAVGLNSSQGLFVTAGDSHFTGGATGFGSTSPYAQLSIESDNALVNSSTPIFVIGDNGSTTPIVNINWAGVVGIATATESGTESLNGIGLAVATNTLIGANLTVTGTTDFQGNLTFGGTATTTFAGGVDSVGLNSSQGLSVSAGDTVLAGKLTVNGSATNTFTGNIGVASLNANDLQVVDQASFGGRLEVNGAATSSFTGGITAANVNTASGLSVGTDAVFGGKITVNGTATNTFTGNIGVASLNANDLQVVDQASFGGRLEVNGVATSSFAGGITVAGLNSSQGLTVSTGDIVGAGKLTINGTGTSTIPNLSSTAISAATLNLSSRIDTTFAGTNTFTGNISLASLNANDLQITDQASFGGRLEVNGAATSSFVGGLTATGLSTSNGLFVTAGDSHFTGGATGFGSTSPYAQVAIEASSIVGSSIPIFVVGSQGTTSPIFGINWAGVIGISTATPVGAENLNGFGLAIATNTLIEGALTVTGTTDFQGNLTFGGTGTTTFAGGVDAVGLNSSRGLSVSAGDTVLAGKLTILGAASSSVAGNFSVAGSLNTNDLQITDQASFGGRLEVNGAATSSFAGGVQAAGLSSSQGITATAGDILGAGKLTISGTGTSTITNLTGTNLNFANLSLTGQFTTVGRLEVNGAATSSFAGGITAAGLNSSQGLTVSTGDATFAQKIVVSGTATSTIPSLSSTAISAATLNLSSRLDSTFAGTNTFSGNISLLSFNANDLQIVDQASFGGRLEVGGTATSSIAGGLTTVGLSTSNGLFVTSGDSHFTGGATGFGSTSPYAQVSIEASSIVGSSTPIFVVGSTGTTSPLFGINWAGVIGISTATPVGAEDLNGFGLAVATNTLIGGNLTVTGTTDFQGGITFGSTATTTFAGGVDAVGLNSSQGLTVTTGDTVLGGKLTVDGVSTSTIQNLNVIGNLLTLDLNATGQVSFGGRLEVNGAATSSFTGGITAANVNTASGLSVGTDSVFGGKITVNGTATSTFTGNIGVASLNANDLQVVDQASFGGRLEVNGVATSSFAGGITVAGLNSSQGLTVTAGDSVFTGKLTVSSTATSTIPSLSSTAISAATLNLSSRIDSTFAGTNTFSGNVSLLSLNANDLQVTDQASFGGRLEVNGAATSSIVGGLTATGLSTSNGLFVTGGDSYFTGGATGFGSTSPYAQVSIEASSIVGSSTPIFVVGSTGTTSPLFGINWAGVIGISTATPVGAENLNGFGLAVATNTLIGGTLTTTGNFDVQGGTINSVTNFGNTGTTTFAGGVDAVGLNSSQGLSVSSGDSVLAGKLTVSSSATSTIPSLSSTAINASTLNLSSRIDSAFAGTNTFSGGIVSTLFDSPRIRVSELVSCDTIDTDASGVLRCGSDAQGAGGGGDLQDAYNNSSDDAQITTANAKDVIVYLTDTATDPNFILAVNTEAEGQFQIVRTDGSATTTSFVVTGDGRTGIATSTPGTGLAVQATTTLLGGPTYIYGQLTLPFIVATSTTNNTFAGALDVTEAATSSFTGGVTAAGLASSQGLAVTTGDTVLAGKLTVSGSATNTFTGNIGVAFLNANDLQIVDQASFGGRLEVNGAATSSFVGGITAAGLNSSQGLTVSTGDATFAQKIVVSGTATSTIPSLSSTAISASTLNLSSRIDSTFAGTNTFSGNISLLSFNANDLQITDQASFGGRLEVNGVATSSIAAGLTLGAAGLNAATVYNSVGTLNLGLSSQITSVTGSRLLEQVPLVLTGTTTESADTPDFNIISATSTVSNTLTLRGFGGFSDQHFIGNLLQAQNSSGSNLVVITGPGQFGVATTGPTSGFGVATTSVFAGNVSIDAGVLDVKSTATSTFDGGITVTTTGGLSSAQGLTITGGDIVSSGKLNISSTATSSNAGNFLNSGSFNTNDLQVVDQASFGGRLEVNGTATSSFAGGIQAVGLSSSQGLAVTAGDTVFTGKLTVNGTGTSTIQNLNIADNILGVDLRITGQSSFAGRLEVTGVATSSFAGGVQAVGLSSSQGLAITAGDSVLTGKLRIDSTATSSTAGGFSVNLLDSATRLRVGELISCDTVDTDASGVLRCGSDAQGAGGGGDLQDAYNNSSDDGQVTTADAKDIVFDIEDTTTDANVGVTIENTSNGRFLVQNRNSSGAATTTVFAVNRDGSTAIGVGTGTPVGFTVNATSSIFGGSVYSYGQVTAPSFFATSTTATSTFAGDAVFRGVITSDASASGFGLTLRSSGSGLGATSTGSIYFQDSSGKNRGRFQTQVLNNGDGADGAITITASTDCTQRDIDDSSTATGPTCYAADLGAGLVEEAPIAVKSGTNFVEIATTSTTWILPGDEIMIIQMESAATTTASVGNASTTPYGAIGHYEFKTVDEVASGKLTVTTNFEHAYYDDDLRNQTQIIRVPNWTNVTINDGGALTVTRYGTSTYTAVSGQNVGDGTGGVLVFRANGTVTLNAEKSIDVSGKGFLGGYASTTGDPNGGAGCNGSQGGTVSAGIPTCISTSSPPSVDWRFAHGEKGVFGNGPGGGGPGSGGEPGGSSWPKDVSAGAGGGTDGGGGGGSGGPGAGGAYGIASQAGWSGPSGGRGGAGVVITVTDAPSIPRGGLGGLGGSPASNTPFMPHDLSRISVGSGGGVGGGGGGGGGAAGTDATFPGGNGGNGGRGGKGGSGGGSILMFADTLVVDTTASNAVIANGLAGANGKAGEAGSAGGAATTDSPGGGGGGGSGGPGGSGSGGAIFMKVGTLTFSGGVPLEPWLTATSSIAVGATGGAGGAGDAGTDDGGGGGGGGGCPGGVPGTASDDASPGAPGETFGLCTVGSAGTPGYIRLDYDAANSPLRGIITPSPVFMVTNQYGQIHAGAVNTVSADIAERYPVLDRSIEPGDIVRISNSIVGDLDSLRTTAYVERSSRPYDDRIIGVISTEPGLELGKDDFLSQPTRPVGLVGRVPVKVTDENGPIRPGDYLTSSVSRPGFAMKATRSGMIIGKALGEHSSGIGTVMLFIDPGYHTVNWTIEINDVLAEGQLQNADGLASGTPSSFVINQKGSGDLLQLQQNETNRFVVHNDGSTELNVAADPTISNNLFVVKVNDAELFKITIRGDIETQGVIVIRNDSFAGSIVTDEHGYADITFGYHLGTGKPSVQLTPEEVNESEVGASTTIASGLDTPLTANIVQFFRDANKNYTGFRIRAFELPSGDPSASTTIHFFVVAKQGGYTTAITTPIIIVAPDVPEVSATATPEIIVVPAPVESPVTPSTDTEPPVLTLNGLNPATVDLNVSYMDLSVIVTDNVDQNLGFSATLDGSPVTNPNAITVDTSTVGTHTIIYSATDQVGNTGTVTRTVNVVDPNAAAATTTLPATLSVEPPATSMPPAEPPTEPTAATTTLFIEPPPEPVVEPGSTSPSTP